MSVKIRRAAVLGAGVMGAQIAAHLAAAGIETYLFDLPSNEAPRDPNESAKVGTRFRSTRAILAIENLKVLKPSPLYTADVLELLKPGNFEDDADVLSQCDWVLEAVVERLDVKQKIHQLIASKVRAGVPVTTNTSGISLAAIAASLPEDYQKNFFGTHFFNPPRYMKLLEMIPSAHTDKGLFEDFAQWAEDKLGKGIVRACDTPNFVANRIGTLVSQSAYQVMAELAINVETVDALTGPLIGRSKSATFRTSDIVGLDTGAAVALNTYNQAPDDPYRDYFLPSPWIAELIEKGSLGQKTKSVGIFKRDRDAKGQTVILAYRPATKTYEPQAPEEFPWSAEAAKEKDTVKRIKLILAQRDRGALFVWRNMRDIFSYAAYLLADIADGYVKPVDDAVRWGFNWEMGPFELWQALGYDEILNRMQEDKVPLPAWLKPGLSFYTPMPGSREMLAAGGPETQLKAEQKSTRSVTIPRRAHQYKLPVFENKEDPRLVFSDAKSSLVDIGDGVACLVFHSKMNIINGQVTASIRRAIEKVGSDFQALVIGNESQHFSTGADLNDFVAALTSQKWDVVRAMGNDFQGTLQQLKYAPFPVVSCPTGLSLGGACELMLHTRYQVLAAETTMGLVEANIGLIPAGGGTKELALRAYARAAQGVGADPFPFLQSAFDLIRTARTASSGFEAIDLGLCAQAQAEVVLSKEHVVHRAKQTALYHAENFRPLTLEKPVAVVGQAGLDRFEAQLAAGLEQKSLSQHDALIARQVATVICGGRVPAGTLVSEQGFLDLEKDLFLELCQTPKTFDRLKAMLATKRPLKN